MASSLLMHMKRRSYRGRDAFSLLIRFENKQANECLAKVLILDISEHVNLRNVTNSSYKWKNSAWHYTSTLEYTHNDLFEIHS